MAAVIGSCCEGSSTSAAAAPAPSYNAAAPSAATPTLVTFMNTAIRNFSEMDGKPVSVEALGEKSDAESTPPTKPVAQNRSVPPIDTESRKNVTKPASRPADKRSVLPDCGGIFDRSMDRIMVADRARDRMPRPGAARESSRERGRGAPIIRDGPTREHSRESRSLNREQSNSAPREVAKPEEGGGDGHSRPHEITTMEQKSNSRSQKRRGESGSIDGAAEDYRDSSRRPASGPYAHN